MDAARAVRRTLLTATAALAACGLAALRMVDGAVEPVVTHPPRAAEGVPTITEPAPSTVTVTRTFRPPSADPAVEVVAAAPAEATTTTTPAPEATPTPQPPPRLRVSVPGIVTASAGEGSGTCSTARLTVLDLEQCP